MTYPFRNEWVTLSKEERDIACEHPDIWNEVWYFTTDKSREYQMLNNWYVRYFSKMGKLFYSSTDKGGRYAP